MNLPMNMALIYPMAAMVLLTFVILVSMFFGRVAAVRAGEANASYYKTYQEGSEPRALAQKSRQIVNLFETPILFYLAAMLGLVTGLYPTVMVVLAWAFVACRVLHAVIHTGKNKLPPRIGSYMLSLLMILAMWTTLVVGVVLAGR